MSNKPWTNLALAAALAAPAVTACGKEEPKVERPANLFNFIESNPEFYKAREEEWLLLWEMQRTHAPEDLIAAQQAKVDAMNAVYNVLDNELGFQELAEKWQAGIQDHKNRKEQKEHFSKGRITTADFADIREIKDVANEGADAVSHYQMTLNNGSSYQLPIGEQLYVDGKPVGDCASEISDVKAEYARKIAANLAAAPNR